LSPGLDALLEGTDIPRDAVIEAALQEATSEQFELAFQRRRGGGEVVTFPGPDRAAAVQGVAEAMRLLVGDVRLDSLQQEVLQLRLRKALDLLGGGA
jgi:hypothetical protein